MHTHLCGIHRLKIPVEGNDVVEQFSRFFMTKLRYSVLAVGFSWNMAKFWSIWRLICGPVVFVVAYLCKLFKKGKVGLCPFRV